MLRKELEKNLAYQIDRRTVFKLLQDLQKLDFVQMHSFKVIVESDKFFNSVNQLNRQIVSNAFVNLTIEELQDDPSISNPYFKRDQELPNTLKFLADDPKNQNTDQNIAQLAIASLELDYTEKKLKTEQNARGEEAPYEINLRSRSKLLGAQNSSSKPTTSNYSTGIV